MRTPALAAVLAFAISAWPAIGNAQGGPIVDTANGIALQARWTETVGIVQITWQVSAATIAAGANDFEL